MWSFDVIGANSNEHWLYRGWVLSHFSSAQTVKSQWSMLHLFNAPSLFFPPDVYAPSSAALSSAFNGVKWKSHKTMLPKWLRFLFLPVLHLCGSDWSHFLWGKCKAPPMKQTPSLNFLLIPGYKLAVRCSFRFCWCQIRREGKKGIVLRNTRGIISLRYIPNIQKGSKVSAFALGLLTAAG